MIYPRPQTPDAWQSCLLKASTESASIGFDALSVLAKALSLTEMDCPVIMVSGTNGKGSCVKLLETFYTRAGYRVGAYTSPHLLRINERIAINGEPLTDDAFIKACTAIAELTQAVILHFFEFLTLAALWAFKQQPLDILLLEVGIGGRLDPVNVIDATVAVITNIDLDHTDRLGETREAIATEKAGIFRPEQQAVCGDPDPPHTLLLSAKQQAVSLACQGQDYYALTEAQHWHWCFRQHAYPNLPFPRLSLDNVSTALMAYHLLESRLPVSLPVLRHVIEFTSLPGRFQEIASTPRTILDVAHNSASVVRLCLRLSQIKRDPEQRIHAVFSALQDKAIEDMIESCDALVSHWHLAPLAHPRKATLSVLKAPFLKKNRHNYNEYPHILSAYEGALSSASSEDIIIVFGSFYTVSAILRAVTP